MLTQIAVLSLVTIAISFYLIGCIRFASRLTPTNSISTYGTLVCFREYNRWDNSSRSGYSFEEYPDNKAGRVPVVSFNVDGEILDISAAASNNTLTEDDIGKQVRIRYRRNIGIVMMIDDERSLKKYNQLRNTLFWVFMCVATILLLMAIPAYFYLPILDGIVN